MGDKVKAYIRDDYTCGFMDSYREIDIYVPTHKMLISYREKKLNVKFNVAYRYFGEEIEIFQKDIDEFEEFGRLHEELPKKIHQFTRNISKS